MLGEGNCANSHSSVTLSHPVPISSQKCILRPTLQSVCQAQWNEINFLRKEWQIPSSHMKGKQGHNRPHEVLLSFQATKLLYSLTPSGSNGTGNLIFSATGNELSGTRYVSSFVSLTRWHSNTDTEGSEILFKTIA